MMEVYLNCIMSRTIFNIGFTSEVTFIGLTSRHSCQHNVEDLP